MTRKSSNRKGDLEVFQCDDTREDAVPVGLASYDTSKLKPKKYAYRPRLDPQLVLAGKAEHTFVEVPAISLHIHERINNGANFRNSVAQLTWPIKLTILVI